MRKNEVGIGHCSLFRFKAVIDFPLGRGFFGTLSPGSRKRLQAGLDVSVCFKNLIHIQNGMDSGVAADVIRPVVQGRSPEWLLRGLYFAGGMSLATFPWTW